MTDDELDRQIFPTRVAVPASGLKLDIFNQWAQREYVAVTRGTGSGRPRQWTMTDLVRLAAAKELVDLGIEVQQAGYLANTVELPLTVENCVLVRPRTGEVTTTSWATVAHGATSLPILLKLVGQWSQRGDRPAASLIILDLNVVAATVRRILRSFASEPAENSVLTSSRDSAADTSVADTVDHGNFN